MFRPQDGLRFFSCQRCELQWATDEQGYSRVLKQPRQLAPLITSR
jgi:hypothetical protein